MFRREIFPLVSEQGLRDENLSVHLSNHQRISYIQGREAAEVPVGGPQSPDAVAQAQGGDAGNQAPCPS